MFCVRNIDDRFVILYTGNVLFTRLCAPDSKFILQISFIHWNFSVFNLNFLCLCIQVFVFSDFKMVDSMSTLSSLELTRNPFDSNREERINCPGFSPSMFCKQETPASQKVSKMFEFQTICE